ncbi:hypothetical protein AYO38_05495 [bacterium SCGC AG-212-C10]|nr:hypothetical protein AYO38_05495 [bacterium SCGC AG-212-C10]
MDAVAQIKSKIDPVQFIGRYARLQKAGRNFKAPCPFHSEKTPSFYVFPERGTWRCFGSCGEGGDVFTFIQKKDNLDFRGALQVLAQEAGVNLVADNPERRSKLERLGRVLSATVDYYQRCLAEPGGEAARAYLADKRGLLPETIATWRIGWAPNEWRGLREYLSGRGYDERDALDAGLLIQPESGTNAYDRFRGRIIIPIADERGVYVGLGGRGLQGEEPKYLNSPQTDLFDKGRTLYGLDLAGKGIRAAGTAVVVEGYMDVIGPWQAGFRNVVASMGTSLTENHASLLRRYTQRIVLAMDPDAAGLAAAERAGGLLLSLESPEAMGRSVKSAEAVAAGAGSIELRVAPLPPGQDPDEIARDDPEGWERAIREAPPFAEFLVRRLLGDSRPESPVEARRLVDRLKPVLLAVSDPVERGMYVQRVSRHLGIAEHAVMERLRPPQVSRRPLPRGEVPRERPSRESMLLAILLRHANMRTRVRNLPPDLFNDAINRELFVRWIGGDDFEAQDGADDDPVIAHARRLLALRLPPLTFDEVNQAARNDVQSILRERLQQRQAAVTEELSELERTLGAKHVAAMSNDAWRGEPVADETMALAQMVIEDLELGLSIHRHESPELG